MSRFSRSTTDDRRWPTRAAAAPALALALVLSACGGDSPDAADGSASPTASSETASSPTAGASSSSGSGSTEVRSLTATEVDFAIELPETELAAGEYEIEVVNEGGASHDLVVERDGEDVGGTEIIAPGESATLTVTLEPGEYVFYCSVANHRGMGMEIEITVS